MDIYKTYINIFPLLRGGVKFLSYKLLRKGITIGIKARIKRNTEWRIFPGCSFKAGSELIVGKDVTMSVAKGASLSIGEKVGIGNRCQIVSHKSITIGDGTVLAPGVMIFDHNHVYDKVEGVKQREFEDGEVVIGRNSWIGAGSIILKNVHIGDRCVIGAGSVVTKDIPSGSVAVGVPAKVIKQ